MDRCPNCGASIRVGARFCTACGFRLVPSDAASPIASETPAASVTSTDDTANGQIQWGPPNRTDGTGAPDPDANTGQTANLRDHSSAVANDPGNDTDDFSPGLDSDDPIAGSAEALPPRMAMNGEPGAELPGGGDEGQSLSDRETGPSTESTDNEAIPLTATLTDEAPISTGSDDPTSEAVTPEENVPARDDATLPDGQAAEGETSGPDDAATSSQESDRRIDPPSPFADGASAPTAKVGATDGTVPAHDDVVSDSTVIQESSWPVGETSSGAGQASTAGEDTDWTEQTPPEQDLSFPPIVTETSETDTDSDEAEASTVTGPSEPSGPGSDVDWEPWRDGVDNAAQPSGVGLDSSNDPAQSVNFPEPLATVGESASGLERVRDLVRDLQATLSDLTLPEAPTVDPEASIAIGLVEQAGQVLDAYSGTPLDSERLDELERLAEDLAGRDYDIRALQRFSQERDFIGDLARGYRQQQDLIQQITGILKEPS